MCRAVQTLTPGYFALVMASGILSIGTHLEGFTRLSQLMLGACVAAFVVLSLLTILRFARFRADVREDFMDPRRAFGFFTFVAGTNVLGVRLGMSGNYDVTAWLLVASGTAWLVLGYVVPWTAVLGPQTRPVVATANGTWFIWVVASQSVAVASATLEPIVVHGRRELAMLAVMSWSVGVFLYAAAGILVSLRLMLYDFGPEDLTPPYWVSMGALAITVLAADRGDGRCPDGDGHPRPHCRTGGGVLGVRDMADTGARGCWLVAARRTKGPAALRRDPVEHHLPARDVQRRWHLSGPGQQFAAG